MGVQIIGCCDNCRRHSHDLKEYGNKELCINCLNKMSIDSEWLIDYKNALDTLNKGMI